MMTWVEVDSKAILHNLKQLRAKAGDGVILMPVIKANAYGHGLINIAQICDKSKEADRLCVASLDEALALLNHKISKPLLILSYYELNTEKVSRAVSKKVGFAVYQIEQAR